MDHALAVGVGDRVGDRGYHRQERDPLLERGGRAQAIAEGVPAQELHRVVRRAGGVLADVVDRHDRRVLEPSQHQGLARHALAAAAIERPLDRDPRALAGQAQGDRPADAAAGADDQCPLSGQFELHGRTG